MKSGIYIYGVIKTSMSQEFGAIGIGNPASEVYTIAFQDIAAVVSTSPFMLYDSLDKEQTIRDLVMHQRVIENVMQRFTIIPVKFGTMVESEEEVVTFLSKGYPLLDGKLCKMEGKIELDVIASWDVQKALMALYQRNVQLQQKQKELAAQGNKVTLEEKITLGKLVERTLQEQKTWYRQFILQMLTDEVTDVCLHEPANEEMIFNAAFLLDKAHEEHFYQVLTALDQKLENALQFRVVGPLPVYSFSTILFGKIDPVRLEAAKTLLGLSEEITERTLRDAYYRLAQKYHPDVRRGEDTLEFSRLNTAYKTLKKFVEQGAVYVEVYHWEKEVEQHIDEAVDICANHSY